MNRAVPEVLGMVWSSGASRSPVSPVENPTGPSLGICEINCSAPACRDSRPASGGFDVQIQRSRRQAADHGRRLIGVSISRAEAITLREIVELTRAGLSDDVLLALIEVDQRVFEIDPDTLKALKDAGVSPRVIVAIVKSGRTPAAAAPSRLSNRCPRIRRHRKSSSSIARWFTRSPSRCPSRCMWPSAAARARAIATCRTSPQSPFAPFGHPYVVSCRSARTPQARGTGVLGLGREAQAGCLATGADAAQQALAGFPAIDVRAAAICLPTSFHLRTHHNRRPFIVRVSAARSTRPERVGERRAVCYRVHSRPDVL